MKALDIKSGRFIEMQDGTKVTIKGCYAAWFAPVTHRHIGETYDYATPRKEDLAKYGLDGADRNTYWVDGGVSVRPADPHNMIIWDETKE